MTQDLWHLRDFKINFLLTVGLAQDPIPEVTRSVTVPQAISRAGAAHSAPGKAEKDPLSPPLLRWPSVHRAVTDGKI